MWPSTTKYFSPFFSYTVSPPCQVYLGRLPRSGEVPLRGGGGEVEAQVVGRVLRIGEHDGPVVGVDHPAVVGGHALLELGGVEVAGLLAQGLGDIVIDEVKPAGPVHPDHRWQVGHPDAAQFGEDLVHDHADLVV